jgi:anion-transporting  ArsA/GET3 family ATPase
VPEPDALREAAYFVERLESEQMPLAGLILNRVHLTAAAGLSVERSLAAAEALESTSDEELTVAALRVHAERAAAAARDARRATRFRTTHPRVRIAQATAQPSDVHDVDGLRAIGAELSAA